jgi:hypothetical protein
VRTEALRVGREDVVVERNDATAVYIYSQTLFWQFCLDSSTG